MKNLIVSVLFIFLVLVLVALTCVSSGGGEISGANSGSSSACCQPAELQATQAASATETYGAEQFYLQLTAIAGQNQHP